MKKKIDKPGKRVFTISKVFCEHENETGFIALPPRRAGKFARYEFYARPLAREKTMAGTKSIPQANKAMPGPGALKLKPAGGSWVWTRD